MGIAWHIMTQITQPCLVNTVTLSALCGSMVYISGSILAMGSANERRHYTVMPSLTGWAHTQNDPCIYLQVFSRFVSLRPGQSPDCPNGEIAVSGWGLNSAIILLSLFLSSTMEYFNSLVRDCSNSLANALALLQSCTKPSIISLHWGLTINECHFVDIFISLREHNLNLIQLSWNFLHKDPIDNKPALTQVMA